MRLVLEQRRHRLEHAATLDEDVLVAVDQDVGDRRVLEQGLERAETRHLVHDLGDEEVELPGVEGEALGDDPLRDDAVDLAAQLVGRQLLERGEVELLDQAPVQAHLASSSFSFGEAGGAGMAATAGAAGFCGSSASAGAATIGSAATIGGGGGGGRGACPGFTRAEK